MMYPVPVKQCGLWYGLRAISQDERKILVHKMISKIILLILQPHLPRANEITTNYDTIAIITVTS